jgi:NAD(P)-dependent dehydrogenase (short-subunit alcohol dehydrogenase family)
VKYLNTICNVGEMTNKRNFQNKTVVITGAAGGLGLAFARRFGQGGAKIAMLDIKQDAVNEASEKHQTEGLEAFALGCDVSDAESVVNALDQVVDHFGGVDVLINNAGIAVRAAFDQTHLSVFHKVMNVNFFGSIYCTRAFLGSLRRSKGLIIVISSLAGFSPLLGRTAYSASKHALHGLFDSLRSELRGSGVGVLIVCPGFTATGFGESALDGDGSITSHPRSTVGKLDSPEHVAEQVFEAAKRNKRLLVLTSVGKLGRIINKLSPALYEWIMVRSTRSELER